METFQMVGGEATRLRPSPYMTLAEDELGPVVAADWIGKFVRLGRLTANWPAAHPDSQLVVVLSVPVRDFAAVLVGCGWMVATAAPNLPSVRTVLAGLARHAPVRVVTKNKVLTGFFEGVDVEKDRVRFGTEWQIGKLQAVTPLRCLDMPRSQPIPQPGVISKRAGLDRDWEARLCLPPRDLALVGTIKWLENDLTAYVGGGGEREAIANILFPDDRREATWSTRIYAASQFDTRRPPTEVRAVVLDGASATKHLAEIETPVVISIMDRSIADESVARMVMNYRNVHGDSVSLESDIGWKPPVGVEAVGFEVPL
jgi:hypothetical protein